MVLYASSRTLRVVLMEVLVVAFKIATPSRRSPSLLAASAWRGSGSIRVAGSRN